jgi:putative ABC transport system permease protein
VVTMNFVLPSQRFDTTERALQFLTALAEQARGLPGVTAAGVTDRLPLGGPSNSAIMIEGSNLPRQARPSATIRSTDGAYLDTMGIKVIAGRDLTPADSGRRVAVVSALAAARLWPQQEPIGKRFRFGEDDSPYIEVVGVAANVRGLGLGADAPPYIYVPMSENYYTLAALAVRTNANPSAIGSALVGIVKELDPQLPIPAVQTMEAIVDDSVARRRFQANLVTLLAVVALLLAGLGIYGVVSQAVSQRTAEFGIRMALGADGGRLRASVLQQALAPVSAGLLVGLGVAVGVGQLLRSLLYEVSPTEPGPLAAVCLVLLGVATLASLIPAWRASRIDPILALRTE